jgi:transposase
MTLEAALALIAELQAQNAAPQGRVAALEAQLAEAGKSSPPAWAKANRAKREGRAGKRRPRAAQENHGRRRSTPTHVVRHAYEHCPDCGYPLRGRAVQRRREVLELPPTPVVVVEHQIHKRYCPVCAASQTPRVSFAGIVLGQGRVGVRLASLIGTLRTTHRLPLAQIQALLEQVCGLRLSVGGLQAIVARLRRQLEPLRA